jgi:Na+/H+-dicarboxylate symporter
LLFRAIIAPLLFRTLVSGIAAHSDLKKVGRMGIKAIIFFEAVTTLALFIGLGAINLSKAGAGVHLPSPSGEALRVQRLSAAETILNIFPENVAKSVAEGQILQVVVFSILFGIALAMVREERRRPLVNLAETLAETMFKFTNLVMYLAPLGVGAAIAYTVGSTGMGILLLGIGQLMDMGRTSVNVLGNCLATVVISRWEGDFGKEQPSPAVINAVAG